MQERRNSIEIGTQSTLAHHYTVYHNAIFHPYCTEISRVKHRSDLNHICPHRWAMAIIVNIYGNIILNFIHVDFHIFFSMTIPLMVLQYISFPQPNSVSTQAYSTVCPLGSVHTEQPPCRLANRHGLYSHFNYKHWSWDKMAIIVQITFWIIFLNGNCCNLIQISVKFVSEITVNNMPSLVQIMPWHWTTVKPLPVQWSGLLMHRCVTRRWWVTNIGPCNRDGILFAIYMGVTSKTKTQVIVKKNNKP